MPEQQLTKEEAEALEAALCTPLANEDELLRAAGDLPAEKLAVAKGLLRLSAHTGLAEDAQRELFAKAGIGFPKPVEKQDPKPDPKPAPKADADPKPAPVASLSKAEVEAELKKRDDTIEKQAGQIAVLSASIAKRDADDDDREVAELVKDYGMPGDKENTAKLVKALTPELRPMWVSSQKSARAALDTLTRQVGRAGGAATSPESAQAKLQALIQSAVQKGGDKPDMDAILRQISAEHPDLFEDARAEAVGG